MTTQQQATAITYQPATTIEEFQKLGQELACIAGYDDEFFSHEELLVREKACLRAIENSPFYWDTETEQVKEKTMTLTKKHVAVVIFQGDADWNVEVRVSGFASEVEAKEYAYATKFGIRLIDGRLYRVTEDGQAIEVMDADVSLSRLKVESRARIAKAHQVYQEKGLDNVAVALESLMDFEANGYNPLVTSDEDYEPVNLPIAKWHEEAGLMRGFESLAYRVE